MTIPIATTTISVKRPDSASDGSTDPWAYPDDPAPAEASVVHTGVRAVISAGGGRSIGPGDNEAIEFSLVCDPVAITHRDVVIDEVTGQEFEVTWALTTNGVAGLGNTRAGMKTIKGVTV